MNPIFSKTKDLNSVKNDLESIKCIQIQHSNKELNGILNIKKTIANQFLKLLAKVKAKVVSIM